MSDASRAVVPCPNCGQKLGFPSDRGDLTLTCRECGYRWDWSAPSLYEDAGGLATDGGISGLVLTASLAAVFLTVTLGLSIYCLYKNGLVGGLILLSLAALSAVVIACVARILLARSHAFATHAKEVNLFFGLVKLVLWNPNEGVLFLKNKDYSQPPNGGGVRFIFPLLGDELVLRVDRTVQRTGFTDKNVRTLEGLLVTIRGNVRWAISDIRKYYQFMSRETHDLNDRGFHDVETSVKQETAERSLAKMIESQTRTLVSQSTIGPLLSKVPINSLLLPSNNSLPLLSSAAAQAHSNATNSGLRQAVSPNVFCNELKESVTPTAEQDGLQIREIEVQEVLLPAELERIIVDRYEMLARADLTGKARQIELEALAKVLGSDVVRLKEVLNSMNGVTFFGVPDFLQRLFTDLFSRSPGPT